PRTRNPRHHQRGAAGRNGQGSPLHQFTALTPVHRSVPTISRSFAMPTTQRTVIITGVGAERGIGRATAHRFAKDGWAVAGLDLDGDASAKLATELTEQYGVPAYGGTVNVAD